MCEHHVAITAHKLDRDVSLLLLLQILVDKLLHVSRLQHTVFRFVGLHLIYPRCVLLWLDKSLSDWL